MTRNTPMVRLSVIVAALAAGGTLVALAGPLDPPPGPVSSTLPVLLSSIDIESLPGDANCKHLISQPGSYHFSRNITGVAGKAGICITVGCVVLDFDGFELVGVPGSGDGINGGVGANKRSIVVRNGCVRNWGGDGIDLGSVPTYAGRIDDIRAIDNFGHGMLSGQGYIITNCVANGNGAAGGATAAGIALNSGTLAIGCNSSKNLGGGIFSNPGGKIQDCIAFENVGFGIHVTSGCFVLENNCRDNGFGASVAANILAGTIAGNGRNRIEGNNCSGADVGIQVASAGNYIVRNTCSGNTNNWFFVANNVYAVIEDRTVLPVSNPVTGNSAATALVTSDPLANFTN
ncbi:MAG: right-handed parallel beta-helix repeat-containing protein [Pyrinomonadaceae bacterium]|nr:right-handed parallel beta-helix repeat-containing protein [Phycisphaerales bacterium]